MLAGSSSPHHWGCHYSRKPDRDPPAHIASPNLAPLLGFVDTSERRSKSPVPWSGEWPASIPDPGLSEPDGSALEPWHATSLLWLSRRSPVLSMPRPALRARAASCRPEEWPGPGL